jgi:hypothetical protein
VTSPETRPGDHANDDDLDLEADDTDEHARSADGGERPDPAPGAGEGGEGWHQQTGYGERVPDPD